MSRRAITHYPTRISRRSNVAVAIAAVSATRSGGVICVVPAVRCRWPRLRNLSGSRHGRGDCHGIAVGRRDRAAISEEATLEIRATTATELVVVEVALWRSLLLEKPGVQKEGHATRVPFCKEIRRWISGGYGDAPGLSRTAPRRADPWKRVPERWLRSIRRRRC
jgi:hypothetical protein